MYTAAGLVTREIELSRSGASDRLAVRCSGSTGGGPDSQHRREDGLAEVGFIGVGIRRDRRLGTLHEESHVDETSASPRVDRRRTIGGALGDSPGLRAKLPAA